MRSLSLVATLSFALAAIAEPGPTPRAVRLDFEGDILPDGASARIGGKRFRDPEVRHLFVDDSGKIVSCFEGNVVRWWDLETGRYLRGWTAPMDCRVWFSADGRLGTWKVDDSLRVWDTWNNSKVRDFPLHGDRKVFDVAFSTDGRSLAAATRDVADTDYPIRHWDLRTGDESVIGRFAVEPYTLHFGDRNSVVMIWTNDYNVTGWDVQRKAGRWQLPLSQVRIVDRAGRRFIAEYAPKESLGLFEAATGQPVPDAVRIPGDDDRPSITDLSPDGHTALTSKLLVWDFLKESDENRRRPRRLGGPDDSSADGVFTVDGKRVAAWNCRLHVYDAVSTKRLTPDLPNWGHLRELEHLHWSNDGKQIQTWARTYKGPEEPIHDVLNWDAATGRLIGPLTSRTAYEQSRQVRHLGWNGEQFWTELRRPTSRDALGHALLTQRGLTRTRDGALMACGRYLDEPRGYDPKNSPFIDCGIKTRTPLHMKSPSVVESITGWSLITLPIEHCGRVAFSPNNRLLAVTEPDGIRLYDVLTGKERLVRKVPTLARSDPNGPAADGVSFSPDGSRLAVIEFGGTVLVFDVALPKDQRPWRDGEAGALWADLASPEPAVAWKAIFHLTDNPDHALKMLADRLTPVRAPESIAPLVADLDSPNFRTREAASKKLLDFGDAVTPNISAALDAGAKGERRSRLEAIQASLRDDQFPLAADLLRLRALTVLVRINSPDTRKLVDLLASGLESARVTREAKEMAKRLAAKELR
jgi:WD40 repeat protein